MEILMRQEREQKYGERKEESASLGHTSSHDPQLLFLRNGVAHSA